MIFIENLFFSYQKENERVDVINNFSASISEGNFVTIVGESGLGKTTLLKLISGLIRPNSGIVNLFNQDLNNLSPNSIAELRLKKIGIIFQPYYLFPELNAMQNVALPLQLNGFTRREAEKKAINLLSILGCTQIQYHLPREMSVGEQQRVAIARALINEHPLIIADEPTANLDEKNRENIYNIFMQLKESGKTVIAATHDSKLNQLSDQTICL
ncbi:hypothetical protein ASZ90_017781 [hydrocarbon metagenome]|uniref:ABC transporter domain-containing protein n=1 Tax=hydrocarbon metagenome TaxID=938273 RepID=A0A0W8E860_9ZZZZ